MKQSTASLLRSVIVSVVIPELARQYRSQELVQLPQAVLPEVSELADLLVQSDQSAAFELITELGQRFGRQSSLYGTLFEPAARRLGDFWSGDICTALDVTLGMSRLQTAARLLDSTTEHRIPIGGSYPKVLIVPEPGELHCLGAALDMSVLSMAGWRPNLEFPTCDYALQDLVSADWFDVLDLSLSAALRREDWLPRVRQTILRARQASLNPALLVAVGGRVFVEDNHAVSVTGADVASKTASNVNELISERIGSVRRGQPPLMTADDNLGYQSNSRSTASKTSSGLKPRRIKATSHYDAIVLPRVQTQSAL